MQEFRWQRKKSSRYICTMCLYYRLCIVALPAHESCLSVLLSVCPSFCLSFCPFSLAASQPGIELVASPPSCLTTHLGQIPQNEHQSKANCACNMTKAPDVRCAMLCVGWRGVDRGRGEQCVWAMWSQGCGPIGNNWAAFPSQFLPVLSQMKLILQLLMALKTQSDQRQHKFYLQIPWNNCLSKRVLNIFQHSIQKKLIYNSSTYLKKKFL